MHLIKNKLVNEDQCVKAARELGSDIEFFFETKPSFNIPAFAVLIITAMLYAIFW